MLRFGPDDTPVVVIALPPFEEANRLRALAVTMARLLSKAGYSAVIPDLPGTGESLTPVAGVRLEDWREAFAASCVAAGESRVVASFRAAALFDHDDGAIGHWRLSPQDGPRLLREMLRTRLAGLREDGRETSTAALTEEAKRDGIELAGHWLTPGLFDDLEDGDPRQPGQALRVVRLGGDMQPADWLVDAPPLWRRAEPDNDLLFAQALAEDICGWMGTCQGG